MKKQQQTHSKYLVPSCISCTVNNSFIVFTLSNAVYKTGTVEYARTGAVLCCSKEVQSGLMSILDSVTRESSVYMNRICIIYV